MVMTRFFGERRNARERESEIESMNETEKSVAKVKKVEINRRESLNEVRKTVQATFEVRVRMKYESDDYN